jgi:hypothetical protein
MSFLEMLRAYTLREYAVILVMAVLGGLGLVFMLNSMGGGAPSSGETLLKREPVARQQTASLRFVEASAAEHARERAAAARRAKILAARREIRAARAARRARTAARSAPATRAVTRTTPAAVTPTPTRIVSTTPSRPVSKPQPTPAPAPKPQKSGTSGGGGGGSFDDSG